MPSFNKKTLNLGLRKTTFQSREHRSLGAYAQETGFKKSHAFDDSKGSEFFKMPTSKKRLRINSPFCNNTTFSYDV